MLGKQSRKVGKPVAGPSSFNRPMTALRSDTEERTIGRPRSGMVDASKRASFCHCLKVRGDKLRR
jgi:hypothetical protein